MTASMRRVSVVWFVALALALSLIGTLATPTRAASITVNTTADENNTDGDCSLREAIAAATTNAAVDACPAGELTPDTITVPAGTYAVSSNLAVGDSLNQEIIIAGAGAATTIMDGGDATRVFRIFGGDVTLSGLTVQRGLVIGGQAGGGITVDGDATLALTNATVTDNHAPGGAGGGIFVDDGGDLDVTGSTISANTATYGGGAYLNIDADTTIDTSVVSGNSANFGGGIFNADGDLEITGSSIINNDANYDAVGDSGGDGGGIWSAGDTSLANTTVSGNDAAVDGGGLYLDDDFKSVPDLEIEASTISGNSALGLGPDQPDDGNGGGIWADGNVGLFNSTVSGNDAAYTGGGIFLQDEFLRSDFSTIAFNTASATDEEDNGGGIYSAVGNVDLYATIVANNTATDCGTNDASIDTLGNNLDSDDSCSLDNAPGSTDHPDGVAGLAGLASNGGPTQTHALLFNSDAIDAVVEASLLESKPDFLLVGGPIKVYRPFCGAGEEVSEDQRGATVGPRAADGDGDGVAVCDIGAYELQLPSASINDVNVIEGNSGTTPATFTVTLSHGYGGTVSFSWATANGTATASADYQSANGTVTFAPGETTRPVTVQVVGDTVDEDNETFTVNLSAPVNGTIADAQGLGTIVDDEGPIVTPTPAAAQLPNTGTGDAGLGGWGVPTLAIAFLAASAAWLRARRRDVGAG